MTQESVFGKYLDVDRQRQKMRELQPGRMLDSVYMQFKDDYQKWKAKQPEVIPPDSQGWTDENLEFLEKHYSGELSAFEIYDALEIMQRMGMLNEKAKNCAIGSYEVRINMKGGAYATNVDPNSKAAWLHGFDEAPMINFHSVSDIFSWTKEFREEDYPDFITGAEALVRGWV